MSQSAPAGVASPAASRAGTPPGSKLRTPSVTGRSANDCTSSPRWRSVNALAIRAATRGASSSAHTASSPEPAPETVPAHAPSASAAASVSSEPGMSGSR